MQKVHGVRVVAELAKREVAGPKRRVSAVQRQRGIALARRVFDGSTVAQHIRQSKTRIGVFRMTIDSFFRFFVGLSKLAALYVEQREVARGNHQIGIQGEGALQRGLGAVKQLRIRLLVGVFGPIGELDVVALAECGPAARVIGVEANGALQIGNGFAVGIAVGGHSDAAEIEIVGLFVFGAGFSVFKIAGSA